MSLRYLLDTSIVSEPITKKPNAAIVRRLQQVGHECAIAAPVWHELQYGCERLPAGARRSLLQAYLRDVVGPAFEVLPYDEPAAFRHAQERARLDALGKALPFVDGQIAAVAVVHGLTLVTRNVRDFARFAGLDVVDWG